MNRNAMKRAMEGFVTQAVTAETNRCGVLWQKSTEPDDKFASRAAKARRRLSPKQLLVVVCALDVVKKSPGTCVIDIPANMLALFDKPARSRVCYGGRAAGRSWTFARALIARSLQSPVRVLCAREFQISISDSIHTLLSDQIDLLGLSRFFTIQNTSIVGRVGSEFIFSGLKANVSKIKSLEAIDIAFVEEGANISAASWETLIPTIRTPGSEIWCAFNPDLEGDPTYQMFVVHPPEDAIVLRTSYRDNPRLPEPARKAAEYLQRVDVDAYANVWDGECRRNSDAQIFRNKFTVDIFAPQAGWDGPYFGLDLGFASDPSVLTKCWVGENKLYVEREAWQLHCDIDKLPNLLDQVPDARAHTIRVDSSRPETVSYLKNHGFPNTVSVEKWTGSVEDGISRMRAFEQIVIHPSCEHTIQEFRLYSYKIDRLTGDVLTDVVDKNNHCIDAIRYGLAPLIKMSGGAGLVAFYMGEVAGIAKTKEDIAKRPGVKITEISIYGH